MKWTDAQRKAIEIRNKNILVSAAAGSGKTAVLVERILRLIIEDKTPLERMLIVTFSNAAASEMREKIVKALSKAIREHAGAAAGQENFLREQLNAVHKANISTFHAFSMEVIKRYFYLIDREPAFRICDEAQKAILQADALEELMHDFFENGDEEFLWFINQYGQAKHENAVKEMILETHEFIRSIPDSFGWLSERVSELLYTKEEFLLGDAFQEIRMQIKEELHLAQNYFLKTEQLLEDHGLESLLIKCRLEAEEAENRIREFEELPFDEFASRLAAMKFQTYRAAASEKEEYEMVKETVSGLRDKGKSIFKKMIAAYCFKPLEEYVSELNETHRAAAFLEVLVGKFEARYRMKKNEKGLLDFNDIEHDALDILSHEEAAAEYREKFLHIFIDEYQDSNIVQETLIGRIKSQNNLFMVGDVKQSIYKFRLAEPELFIKKYEAFSQAENETDEKIDLNQNFRSKGSIICAVNDVFKRIMRKDVSGLDYDDAAALYKGVDYEGELDYAVSLHVADDRNEEGADLDEEIAEMKKAQVEAFTAARLIRESVSTPIYDGKKGEVRELRYRDIVILLRGARGTADIYYEALSAEGIPSFVDISDGYFDTIEIEVFLNLLRVIDNRRQDVPLLSILRAQLFGFSAEELIEVRIMNKTGSYCEAFDAYSIGGPDEILRNKCRKTLEQIEAWNRASAYMSLEDLLWRLMRETTYYEYIGAIPGGTQRQANLRALIDKAVQFQNSQMKGLFHFIRYIEAVKKEKTPTGQVKLLGEKDDVVRIMTIHKSKGLEFPMVIAGGLGKKFVGGRGGRVSLHKDIGIGLRWVDKENHSYKKTILQTIIEQKKRREDMAEEIRVLYVAFTRAMDRLVLLGSVSDIEKTLAGYEVKDASDVTAASRYLDFLLPAAGEMKIPCCFHNKTEISGQRTDDEDHMEVLRELLSGGTAKVEFPELQSEIARRFDFQYGYEKALSLKSKFTVSELSREKRPGFHGSLREPAFNASRKGFTGAERGTILHKIMEHMAFGPVSAEGVRNFTTELASKGILSEEEAAAADVNKVVGFMQSGIGKRAAAAGKLEKELPFNLLKELSGETVIVQGMIDCCFEEEGGYVLLDYKSNYIGDVADEEAIEALVEGYRPQVELYREALEKIRNIAVKECYLYLFSINKEVRI